MFENFLRNKKIENAVIAVNKDPDNIIKLDILGRLYFENNFFDKGINTFEKILKIDEKYLPALELLSKAYIKTKQYLKAYRTLKTLYAYLPDDFKVKTMLLSLKNADCDIEAKTEIVKGLCDIDDSIELKELLSELYFKSGQFSKAASIMEILTETSDNADYFLKLASIYIKLNNINKAISCYENLMQINCFTPEHSNKLAELYVKVNRFDEAKAIFELLKETFPENSEVYNEKIAKIHLLENNPDKVIEVTREVLEDNKYSVEAKFLHAEALINKKEYKEAVEFLREFLCDPIDEKTEKKIQNKIIETSILYSQSLRKNKKYAEAIDALTPALRYDDNNKNIYIELARISTEIKDYSSAKEYMKIADEL